MVGVQAVPGKLWHAPEELRGVTPPGRDGFAHVLKHLVKLELGGEHSIVAEGQELLSLISSW